jgi:hypothetical protein
MKEVFPGWVLRTRNNTEKERKKEHPEVIIQ